MRRASALVVLATLVAGALLGCSGDAEQGPARDAGAAVDPAFVPRLEAAVRAYEQFGRVDDLGRWAPEMCAAPLPPAARFSASTDAATHGGKLYSMYAKDRRAYVGLSSPSETRFRPSLATEVAGLEDCTQVVVKETFAPVAWKSAESADPEAAGRRSRSERDEHGLQPALKDGAAYASGARTGLFVMLRLDPGTANTDDGWVYGTVAPDGTVTSCGRVASCMACHAQAPHGRLFGLPAGER